MLFYIQMRAAGTIEPPLLTSFFVQDYNAPAPRQNTFGATPVEEWSADPWTVPPVQTNQHQQDWQADVSF
jgi:hypothetical protein